MKILFAPFAWFILYSAIWLAGLIGHIPDMGRDYWRLVGLAGFYALFFVMPLFRERQGTMTGLYALRLGFVGWTLYPADNDAFIPCLLLILALQAAEMAWRIHSVRRLAGLLFLQGAVVALVLTLVKVPLEIALFAALFMLLVIIAAPVVHNIHQRGKSAQARYDALLSEYRGLKRRALSEEELARQEERALIGREIHDSVGHKLTALLMQLEAYRLKAGEQEQEQVQRLKKLAEDSLDETRRAVRSYKQGEAGGLQGIMRLIRNLESNSYLRVHFSVHHGAFSFPLNGEQSFAIYRAVQEALTNMMKHAKAREASVRFEAPGGSVFRFEISNPIAARMAFKEGFGLQSMRERLTALGGDLEVFQTADAFVVRGWIRQVETGDRP